MKSDPSQSSYALISPLAIAPMIDWTYTHFRVLMRLLAPKALLYTEMQTVGAVKHNPVRALSYAPIEQPLGLQLGGSELKALVECAKIAEDQGFAEVNLNLGCPSDKVQAGRFGACLMAEPEHVASCIAAMKQAVSIPVTAKTRIGIDKQDSYAFFAAFAEQLIVAGCDKLIVHARKAWLQGLSPKQNRTIPALHYEFAYNIKKAFPQIPIVINGNIDTLDAIKQHMEQVDGIMIGRLACQNPFALTHIHQLLFAGELIPKRSAILRDYLVYIQQQISQAVPLSLLLKPIFNLAHGLPGAKFWKNIVAEALQYKQWTRLEEALLVLEQIEAS